MSYQKERDEFIGLWVGLGAKTNDLSIRERIADAREVLRLAPGIQGYAETLCNRETTDAEVRRNEKRRIKIAAIAKRNGFDVRFSQDPRGSCVRLRFPDNIYNSWDGETYGVPTR